MRSDALSAIKNEIDDRVSILVERGLAQDPDDPRRPSDRLVETITVRRQLELYIEATSCDDDGGKGDDAPRLDDSGNGAERVSVEDEFRRARERLFFENGEPRSGAGDAEDPGSGTDRDRELKKPGRSVAPSPKGAARTMSLVDGEATFVACVVSSTIGALNKQWQRPRSKAQLESFITSKSLSPHPSYPLSISPQLNDFTAIAPTISQTCRTTDPNGYLALQSKLAPQPQTQGKQRPGQSPKSVFEDQVRAVVLGSFEPRLLQTKAAGNMWGAAGDRKGRGWDWGIVGSMLGSVGVVVVGVLSSIFGVEERARFG